MKHELAWWFGIDLAF